MTSGKRVAIVQSNYLPWKGYFDLVNSVDEFVLLDEVQYTRRDWRNRNRIKTRNGTTWLTIPVEVKGKYWQLIDETRIADGTWTRKHWRTLSQAYATAPFFAEYREQFERLYEECADVDLLSMVNRRFIELVCDLLRIGTKVSWSTDYRARVGRSERLLDLCLQTGAAVYVSGPAARDYLDERLFADGGVDVEWMSYDGYPAYPQPHPPFDHHVSCVDMLFSVGPQAPGYMLSFAA